MVFWLSTIMFLGCQTASTQVAQAVMLEQQGDSVAAFDIYKSILSQYSNTPEAKRHFDAFSECNKMAKSLENTDPKRAVVLYQSMLDRILSEYGLLAKEKIAMLTDQAPNVNTNQGVTSPVTTPNTERTSDEVNRDVVSPEVEENTLVDQAEFDACETAQKSQSRIVWQQYKKTFPNGVCIDEAEEFLRTVAPRQMEIDQAGVTKNGWR